ncbi:hypothetical protein [Flectobacillus sp. BAB-3569]|uniref:hypothetical protein n=1 Tax=Flectobacillus sp. BAB-3569 TaxID=1509483 RepID=UPI000BA4DA06|nr:hypothetical protein [Flectobacillus sp. BAB-3569]PAC26460.1 hypothetical protein BWI92_25820 [Flectobacillus sp. BAB-3569]
MENYLVLTVGTRDIQVNDKDLQKSLNEDEILALKNPYNSQFMARPLGELIERNFSKFQNIIHTPIIAPLIQYLVDYNIVINKVFIISTDQPHDVESKYRNNDSVFFGKIIARILRNKLPQGVHISMNEVLITENVTFLDEMYRFFSESDLIKEIEQNNNSINSVFLLNQGGIDAINTGLMLNIIKASNIKLRHFTVDERTKFSFELDFAKSILAESEHQKASALLRHYDYAAIKYLSVKNEAKAIAKYAECRLHFNFSEAKRLLNELSTQHRKFSMENITQLNLLTSDNVNKDLYLIRELYINARIKFDQESYVDFLLRFFRIHEFMVQYELSKYLDFEIKYNTWVKDIHELMGKNTKLKNHLMTSKHDKKPLNFEVLNIPTSLSILEFYKHPEFLFLKSLRGLSELRNKSIGAHDFEPVSRNLIESALLNRGYSINTFFEK